MIGKIEIEFPAMYKKKMLIGTWQQDMLHVLS